MKKTFTLLFFSGLMVLSAKICSQNQATKWYFGTNAGLDFMTNPPTIITNAAMSAWEGSASIADAAGNLLFYTDGITVYNANNVTMANGTGLLGDPSSTQSGVIIQQPGTNSIYYIFTLGAMNGPLNYSTVDMTLAAGLGSVTVKNATLYPNSSEKLTAVRHCNGTDVWAISHDMSNNNFRTFLITAAGVNTVPIISSLGTTYTDARGYLKASPNGKKLGLGDYSVNNFEIYDFDNSTGVVSNQVILGNHSNPYGCEFSPDGTKFYGCCEGGESILYQWDLCAGSGPAITASQFTIATTPGVGTFALQAAPNGKIYMARITQTDMGVINNPNVYGNGCNFVDQGQSIAPNTNGLGLPNFITSFFKAPAPPFTYTVTGCQSVNFMAPSIASTISCTGNYSVTGMQWNFGDPNSGAANTSTASNPTHIYSTSGNYVPKLIIYYPCSTDTVKIPVSVTGIAPTLGVAGTFTICKGQTKTYTVSGANTYSWSSGSTVTIASLSPTATTVYNVTGTSTLTGCKAVKSFTVVVSKCTGIDELTNTPGEEISIYPNPVSGVLNLDAKKDLHVVIYNPLGALIYDKIIPTGQNTLDMSTFSNGIYLVKIIDGANVKVTKLVKTD